MTGSWMGDGEVPALPVTDTLLAGARGEPSPGAVLEQAMARSRASEAREAAAAAAAAVDPDERAAAMVVRGLRPGTISHLAQRLADAEGELETERAKLAKGEQVSARVRGLLERGQVGGLEASRMLDGDHGDAHRAQQLAQRVDRLREQLAEAQALISPQAQERTGVEEAASRARRVLADVTAQRQAEDAAEAASRAQLQRERSAFYASRGRRPFASRGDVAEPDCLECAAAGATAEESFLIHQDPEPVPVPDEDAGRGVAAYAPGEVITTGYSEMTR
jgi:hypothetical protein